MVLILAGGSGKRLWPFVDARTPKFLFKPFKNKTLLENTLSMARKLVREENIFIITTQNQRRFVYDLIPQALYKNILIEPETKDTAFALIYGAFKIFQRVGAVFLLNLATDHLINNISAFRKGIATAMRHKEFLYLFTSPIQFPSIHHGYVKLGKKLYSYDTKFIFKIDKFIEKPKIEQAKIFSKRKNYRWNCGIFFWHFRTFMEECKKVGQLFKFLHKIANDKVIDAYSLKSPGSIEFSLLQRTRKLATVDVNIGWFDLGTWENVVDFMRCKKKNVENRLALHNAENINIFGDFKNVKVIGLKNAIIVKNKDDLLISQYGETFHLKNLVR